MTTKNYQLYRDDDISATTNIAILRDVHSRFIKANKVHTVAVLMEDIWDNKEVWYFLMTAKNLAVGLHGWSRHHLDYGVLATHDSPNPDDNRTRFVKREIAQALEYWKVRSKRGGYTPPQITTFFPPWNSVSPQLETICNDLGLKLDSRVGGEVFNFHYWACQEAGRMKQLEEALGL